MAFFVEGQVIMQLTDFIGGWLFKPSCCLRQWQQFESTAITRLYSQLESAVCANLCGRCELSSCAFNCLSKQML